jgi:hypothetical protein
MLSDDSVFADMKIKELSTPEAWLIGWLVDCIITQGRPKRRVLCCFYFYSDGFNPLQETNKYKFH